MADDGDSSLEEDHVAIVTEKLNLTSPTPVSHVQLACCNSHCAFPWQGNELRIYINTDFGAKPLNLIGHHENVSALAFGARQDPLLLCSASNDYVIVWDIEQCYRRDIEGLIASGVVIGTCLGRAQHLSLCSENEKVAVCSGAKTHILNIQKRELVVSLSGHLGSVTAAEFCPWDGHVLLTSSEDRTFKVWDLRTEECLYQSSVLSAFPLLSLFISEEKRQLITGSTNGQVWAFSLPEDFRCRVVSRVDLQKVEQRRLKHMEGSPANKPERQPRCQSPGSVPGEQADTVETSRPVLRLSPCTALPGCVQDQERCGNLYWIGSTDSLFLLDLDAAELRTALYLKDYPNLTFSMAGSWAIHQRDKDKILCVMSSPFESAIILFEVQMSEYSLSPCPWEEILTVFPSGPLLPESPLNAVLVRKGVPKPIKKPGPEVKVVQMDRPLTFHPRVKSSGYATRPWACTNKVISPKKSSMSVKTRKKPRCILPEYPEDIAVPTVLYNQVSAAERPAPVSCLQYSGDGKHVLCGLGNASALLYKSTLAGTTAVYTGHDGPINTVDWSFNRKWVVTSAEDRTVRVWPIGNAEPILIMGDDKFSKPVKSAHFYYLDKFMLLASGPALHLYLYHLHLARDDIKRYHQKSLCKPVGRFKMSSGTDITCTSTINQLYSYIVLAAGVDRSVEVFDMNVGHVCAEIPDAHTRAVHHITQNQGSVFSTQAPDLYNLFLTGAVTDGLKLWDLRTLRCVRRYEGHANRCHPCGAAFSPCGRYIATGSEDNCAYVYDIRSCTYLHKLQRHSDPVLTVAFNPAKPELMTGTLDGKLQLFRPSNGAAII
ncbi:WD repeat-containing protein 27 [Conger conger]|uniref:WD repeat-containing protein 27 n=1 Tax=Conger conger TaxID=82655 RepID=UPI002A59DAFF|nr:WD repeat-containing protein 27 [Conger conger]